MSHDTTFEYNIKGLFQENKFINKLLQKKRNIMIVTLFLVLI